MYANDSQLLLTYNHKSSQSSLAAMERGIAKVKLWTAWKFLKLNDNKTEFVVVGAKWQLTKAAVTDISFGESVIPAILKARNICAMIDSNCGLHAHVNKVCR